MSGVCYVKPSPEDQGIQSQPKWESDVGKHITPYREDAALGFESLGLLSQLIYNCLTLANE